MDRNAQSERTIAMDPLAKAEALPPDSRLPVAQESGDLHAQEERIRAPDDVDHRALLSPEETGDLRVQWNTIQTGFVDKPRNAVRQADHLVALTLERLMSTFNAERARLESQWDKGGEISTEDLRVALQRYRSFFRRLLST